MIIYVDALWSLNITLSLCVSAWATLCQESYTLHLQGRQPEDYAEMTTKRQCTSEATKWEMETVLISIPVVLHISLSLFLVGLRHRLADKNRVLGFVAGIPAAIIVAKYIVFTNPPFYTALELIELVLGYFRHPPQSPRILRPLILILLTDASSSGFPSKDQSNPIFPPDVSSFLRRKFCNAKQTSRRLTLRR